MEHLVMTVDDLRQAMCISRSTAYELVNRSDFPAIRVGRKIVIPRDAFKRWLDEQAKLDAATR